MTPRPAKENLARLLVPHSPECTAMESVEAGHWRSDPWWVPATYLGTAKVVNRAADGSKRGDTYKWFVVSCNATNCPAEGIIRELAITGLFDQLIG